MENINKNPRENILKIYILYQYLSPVAIIALLSYSIGTIFFNPSWDTVLISRIILTLYFSFEYLTEFILYEKKIEFIRHYWWRVALIFPIIGTLLLIDQITYLSQLLSILKTIEEFIKSLNHYGYVKEK